MPQKFHNEKKRKMCDGFPRRNDFKSKRIKSKTGAIHHLKVALGMYEVVEVNRSIIHTM